MLPLVAALALCPHRSPPHVHRCPSWQQHCHFLLFGGIIFKGCMFLFCYLLPLVSFFFNFSSSVSPGCYTTALVVWILLEYWHKKVVLCFRRFCWFSCYEATGNVSQKRMRIQSQCTASLCVKNLLHKLMFWHIKSCSVFFFRGMR